MRPLTGERLLTACDEAAKEDCLARSLTLLSLALPEKDRRELARLSLAERNVLLLRLHELSFGSTLEGFGPCSHCSAHLEFALPVSALIEHLNSRLPGEAMAWSEEEREYRLRAVTTADLMAVLDVPDLEEAQKRLLQRCVSVSGAALNSSSFLATPSLLERFNQLHESAELSCSIHCPDCSHDETLDLDIARFLWLEVRRAGQKLLEEIHELAWAYGWSERAIARMHPRRRNAYLEMLTA
ncbi:MAG TPA: hypothetical protein VGR96_13255 [Acidobacteriaceae bacterium]|nr:hypothetical protein [Acidobacteriaceae bacterium]